MAIFTNHKLKLTELLDIIPEEHFSSIAKTTNVDHYCKALNGKLMFYLLLYSLLTSDKLGQRGIADLYASPNFRALFYINVDKEKISHSSISERLSKIESEYFLLLYEEIYRKFSRLYPSTTICGFNLNRVDSTLVTEMSNKLASGLSCGNEYKKSKMLKYTITYDGMYGVFAQVHNDNQYASETLALPECVLEHFKKVANF